MRDFLFKYWIQVALGTVVTGLGLCVKKLKKEIDKRKIEDTALKEGVKALLRHSILSQYHKCIEQGFCPIYSRENIDALYQAYRSLGGNGVVTKLMSEIRKLPTERENLHEEN